MKAAIFVLLIVAVTAVFPDGENVSDTFCNNYGINVCKLPKEQGSCKAHKPRYYYSPETKTCEKFIYGGCRGNKNNFETKEECEATCSKLSGPVCHLPSERGPCLAKVTRYYYDQQTGSCQEFNYGGCCGNENKFETFEKCQEKCEA